MLAHILFVIIHQLNSLSHFWLAESVQWIFEISAIYLQIIRTITMSRTFKVSCNHAMYDCVSWFLKIKEFTHFGSLALSEDWSRNLTSFFFIQCIINQLLDAVFMISRIIKVSVKVNSLSLWLQLLNPIFTFSWLFWRSQNQHTCNYEKNNDNLHLPLEVTLKQGTLFIDQLVIFLVGLCHKCYLVWWEC